MRCPECGSENTTKLPRYRPELICNNCNYLFTPLESKISKEKLDEQKKYQARLKKC